MNRKNRIATDNTFAAKILWLVDCFTQIFLKDCRKCLDREDIDQRVIDFDINGNGMRYDLSATVHYKETKDGNGHYTAISRSQDWQSRRWFMYDDDRVSLSNFTKTNTMVKKSYMKTATILFYVSPSSSRTPEEFSTASGYAGGPTIFFRRRVRERKSREISPIEIILLACPSPRFLEYPARKSRSSF